MTQIRQHLTPGLRIIAVSLLVSVLMACLLTGCASNTDIAETFAMAYSQSVSKKVYDENMRALTKYLSPELEIQLKRYPSYLEDNKRATAEIVANYETPSGAIIYTDVKVSEKTQYTLRFDMRIEKGTITDCSVQVLYKRPPVYIH